MPVNPFIYLPVLNYDVFDEKIVNMAVGDDAWVIYNGYPVLIRKTGETLLALLYSYCDDDSDTCLLSFDYNITDDGHGHMVNKNVSCYDLSQDDTSVQSAIENLNTVLTSFGYQIDEIVLENGETEGELAGVFMREFAWDKVIGFIEI